MANQSVRLAALVALWPCFPSTAGAALVTVEFEGTVREVLEELSMFSEVSPGHSLTGTLFFDDEQLPSPTSCTAPSDAFCATYQFTGEASGLTLSIGGQPFDTSDIFVPLAITVRRNLNPDFYLWRAFIGPVSDGTAVGIVNVFVEQDPVGTTPDLVIPQLTDEAEFNWLIHQPIYQEIIIDPDTGFPTIVTRGGERSQVYATLTGLHVVPEPAAVILLLSAGALWLTTRSRLAPLRTRVAGAVSWGAG